MILTFFGLQVFLKSNKIKIMIQPDYKILGSGLMFILGVVALAMLLSWVPTLVPATVTIGSKTLWSSTPFTNIWWAVDYVPAWLTGAIWGMLWQIHAATFLKGNLNWFHPKRGEGLAWQCIVIALAAVPFAYDIYNDTQGGGLPRVMPKMSTTPTDIAWTAMFMIMLVAPIERFVFKTLGSIGTRIATNTKSLFGKISLKKFFKGLWWLIVRLFLAITWIPRKLLGLVRMKILFWVVILLIAIFIIMKTAPFNIPF